MVDAETAAALLAGFISGAAVAFATTALALIVAARSPGWRQRAAQTRLSLPVVGVVIVNGMMLLWTLTGLLLGAAYLRAESRHPDNGLLSSNWLFTALVAGGIAAIVIALWIIRGRLTVPTAVTAAVVLLAFGWMLPLLAASA